MTTCPRCGSVDVDCTTVGGIGCGNGYDDVNRAKCCKCKHSGKRGDWQRIAELRAYKERTEAALRELTRREMEFEYGRADLQELGLWRDKEPQP